MASTNVSCEPINLSEIPVIEAENLCFKYTVDSNARRPLTSEEIEKAPLILSNITFNLKIGDRVLLCGANGAGKSTLLEILAGKKRPISGTCSLLGEASFRSKLSNVLLSASWADDISKLSTLPVFDLLESSIKTAILRIPTNQEDKEAVSLAIRKRGVALARLLEVDAAWITTELSEGQKRRVQLTTCLVYPSHLILLDEVTAELDILTRRRLLNFLAKDCRDRNATLIYCTHVFDGLNGFISKVMQLSNGSMLPLAPSLEKGGSVHAKVLDWLETPDNTEADLLLKLTQDRILYAKAVLGDNIQTQKTEDEVDNVISVHNLTWGYGGSSSSSSKSENNHLLFTNASFSLKPGSRCILTGSNGCGKTTLLSILGGSRLPVGYNDNKDEEDTSIQIVGVDPVTNYSTINREVVHVSAAWRTRMREIINGGAELCVAELSSGAIKHATQCLMTQIHIRKTTNKTTEEKKVSTTTKVEKDEEDDVSECDILNAITRRFAYLKSLLSVGDNWVMSRLSSGQKARVQLCLQLLLPTRVILMDEITAELDVNTRSKLFQFLKEESDGPLKVCILYATHVLEGLDDWFTHILHLRKPRIYDKSEAFMKKMELELENNGGGVGVSGLNQALNCILLTKKEAFQLNTDSFSNMSSDDDIDKSFSIDSGILFQVCLYLLLKERDEDLKYYNLNKEVEKKEKTTHSNDLTSRGDNPEEEDKLSFPSSAYLLRAKADERISNRSNEVQDRIKKLPTGWSFRTNKLPGGLGSHTWGVAEAEDLPPVSIEDASYMPDNIPNVPTIVFPSTQTNEVSTPPAAVTTTAAAAAAVTMKQEVKEVVVPKKSNVALGAVLLPVIGQLETSISALKLALESGDVEAVAAGTTKVTNMWKLMEPALNDYTGTVNTTTAVTTTAAAANIASASSSASSCPFGPGPRGNTMSETALISNGMIVDPNILVNN